MKKYLLLLWIMCGCFAFAAQNIELKFHDGKFKILQITDLHLIESESYKVGNDSTYALIRTMIDSENPDIVILTGDCVVSYGAKQGWEKLTRIFIDKKVPFAVAFGNHDEETDMNNAQILKQLQANPYNLTYDAEKLSGSGNCSLPVLSSDGKVVKWVLYLFDSHNNRKDRTLGYYQWIQHDQIDWYRKTSDEYTVRNNNVPVPSLAFFHIPFLNLKLQNGLSGK
jgi:Predicted phosphohydrolases